MSWPMVKLGDVCQITMGQAPSGSFYNEKGQGYALIAGAGDFGQKKPIPKKYTTKASKLSKLGDIILCIRATIGDLNWSDKEYCLGRGVAGLRGKESLDQGFLWHCLNYNRNVLSSKGTGSTFKQISRNHIEELIIPLPPIEEQRRIADILDKADGIRQKRKQAIKLAENFLRVTFLEMFNNPVKNPKNLKKAPITELAEIITGFAFKSNDYVGDSLESVRLCRGANTLTGYLDWGDTKFWPKNKLEKLDNYLIKAGDIILAMDRPWISNGLKVCIFPENQRETYLVQRVARLRPRCESYTNYIYSCIKSPAFEKHCRPTETTVPHISPVELKNFEVLIPNSELMDKYHSIASTINNSLNKMDTCNISGDALFSKLCQQAFSGHLKR
ncbi:MULTISPECIES: restriction endonuclease subunit S [Enterobacterales]|uniref:restriction endonuclease subunit S n=1 Tax=Enterobacterales TaxID=91347 RepID=UPI00111B3911|nr:MULTISPECIES: restriction endonuclease subunit S [Enterobacterales]HBR6999757.1 restriction endonuclease subunit S [Klebsiella aerogenes]HDU5018720.1 restriction endonuclease subunit S [Klebsiella quasipneumoniae subsp. quasipneumoniae]NKE93801.1 hypothetical protein [Pantoea agglomerans]TRO73779.1 restriction endonuclease subunit S [Pantoea agglomerans]GJL44298.1 hypothetical protein TUM17580_03570 [Citrobacter farmeri]